MKNGLAPTVGGLPGAEGFLILSKLLFVKVLTNAEALNKFRAEAFFAGLVTDLGLNLILTLKPIALEIMLFPFCLYLFLLFF